MLNVTVWQILWLIFEPVLVLSRDIQMESTLDQHKRADNDITNLKSKM